MGEKVKVGLANLDEQHLLVTTELLLQLVRWHLPGADGPPRLGVDRISRLRLGECGWAPSKGDSECSEQNDRDDGATARAHVWYLPR